MRRRAMIKVNVPDVLPANIQAWVTRAEEIRDEILVAPSLEEKHQLIDRHKAHWRDEALVEWLSSLNHDKCWYTETKFGGDYQEVEHFRPKKATKCHDGAIHPTHPGYYWLAFELSNYRLCKSRPNRKKSTFFPIIDERFRAAVHTQAWQDETPLFLDPLKESDVLLLSFNDDGAPLAQDGIGEADLNRVNFTIDKYFLNERVLNSRRSDTWQTSRALFFSYQRELKTANDNGSVAARTKAEEELKKLKALLAPDSEFSSVAKESLCKLGDIMAIKIACA